VGEIDGNDRQIVSRQAKSIRNGSTETSIVINREVSEKSIIRE
jgi:hypothetical protein